MAETTLSFSANINVATAKSFDSHITVATSDSFDSRINAVVSKAYSANIAVSTSQSYSANIARVKTASFSSSIVKSKTVSFPSAINLQAGKEYILYGLKTATATVVREDCYGQQTTVLSSAQMGVVYADADVDKSDPYFPYSILDIVIRNDSAQYALIAVRYKLGETESGKVGLFYSQNYGKTFTAVTATAGNLFTISLDDDSFGINVSHILTTGGGKFFLVDTSAVHTSGANTYLDTYYSTDGQSWTHNRATIATAYFPANAKEIYYSTLYSKLFILSAWSDTSNARFYYSSDLGASWSYVNVSSLASSALTPFTYTADLTALDTANLWFLANDNEWEIVSNQYHSKTTRSTDSVEIATVQGITQRLPVFAGINSVFRVKADFYNLVNLSNWTEYQLIIDSYYSGQTSVMSLYKNGSGNYRIAYDSPNIGYTTQAILQSDVEQIYAFQITTNANGDAVLEWLDNNDVAVITVNSNVFINPLYAGNTHLFSFDFWAYLQYTTEEITINEIYIDSFHAEKSFYTTALDTANNSLIFIANDGDIYRWNNGTLNFTATGANLYGDTTITAGILVNPSYGNTTYFNGNPLHFSLFGDNAIALYDDNGGTLDSTGVYGYSPIATLPELPRQQKGGDDGKFYAILDNGAGEAFYAYALNGNDFIFEKMYEPVFQAGLSTFDFSPNYIFGLELPVVATISADLLSIIEATAYSGAVASADLLSIIEATAYSGAVASADLLSIIEATASATVSTAITATIKGTLLSIIEGNAVGTVADTITATIEGTLLSIIEVPVSASINATLLSIIEAELLLSVEPAYRTYIVNAVNGEITQSSLYDFIAIYPFGNKLIGIATDGVYELTGVLTTDEQNPIIAYAKTNPSDWGIFMQKRFTYSHHDSNYPLEISVFTYNGVEVQAGTYTTQNYGAAAGRSVERAVIGRGAVAFNFAFTFANHAGNDLELLGSHFIINELTRKV